eukprot:COSAG06_NODE_6407_length_2945_cov_76.420942_3_plen_98_part_00
MSREGAPGGTYTSAPVLASSSVCPWAHPDDMRRTEVIQHAELVRKGRIPKAGSIVMDVDDYDDIAELKRRAGYRGAGPHRTLDPRRAAPSTYAPRAD